MATGMYAYLRKPFQFEEVSTRVETHLRLRRQQLELEEGPPDPARWSPNPGKNDRVRKKYFLDHVS